MVKLLRFFLAIPLLISFYSDGQTISKVPYRSIENPYYWKHRMPRADYWQQDVAYEIKASLDDSTGILTADFYKLTYYNNSPFALKELYFHLNENAFQPGSYYDNLTRNNHITPKFGKYEVQGLGIPVANLLVNDAAPAKITLDNTIMRVDLVKPLQAGDSLVVTCQFKNYFDGGGSMRRRGKTFDSYGFKQFDGVHWYPQICVYDAKFGWTTDQHLDKEFYNNFGSFDIEISFPNDYIVEATGDLMNRSEVLPDTLRQKLDISNFKTKPWGSASSVIIPRVKGESKTWKFYAYNVHNFAFTADPLYRIGEVDWNGIKCISLAQEPNASKWQESANFAANVIKTYSRDFGMYAWPKIIVADAKDGMEYPMLTLDNGTYPNHQSLLAHEIGHMWFYGMVGSNETYRAFLDEGFTQFITTWSMDKLTGAERDRLSKSKYVEKHLPALINRYDNLYYPYLKTVDIGGDEPLNTHSSGFNGAIRHGGSYGLVYYKTGVMLYNLRYVLGDTLFLSAMKHYFNKWKMCHPYPEDFRQSIIEYTQVDLNWFFDQWLETTKTIDYGIKRIRKVKGTKQYKITIIRKGRMQMPLDITITSNGKKQQYHIPNTWFVKSLDSSVTVLPKWYGWDLLQPEYTFKAELDKFPSLVQIDSTHTLADVDMMDNTFGCNKGDKWGKPFQFDHRVPGTVSWTTPQHYWRPDVWYNSFDGTQVGLHAHGTYFGKRNYHITGWYNTRLGQYNLPEGTYNKNQAFGVNAWASQLIKRVTIKEYFAYNAGLIKPGVSIEKVFQKQDARNPRWWSVYAAAEMMYRPKQTDSLYLVQPGHWSIQRLNSYVNAGVTRNVGYSTGNVKTSLDVRLPGIASEFNYSKVSLTVLHTHNWKKFEFKNRLFGQYGFGNFATESALYLAGGNPEEMYGNKYTRAAGIVPYDWAGYGLNTNNFQYGGGLNLRGYAGYINPYTQEGKLNTNYIGRSGISFNTEIDFDQFIKFKPKRVSQYLKMDTYFFGDFGMLALPVDNAGWKAAPFRMDAGLGTALSIKFTPYDIKPLVVRFDMPLFLNAPAATDNMFDFRYVVSINRSF